jgi:hypothetical protein
MKKRNYLPIHLHPETISILFFITTPKKQFYFSAQKYTPIAMRNNATRNPLGTPAYYRRASRGIFLKLNRAVK